MMKKTRIDEAQAQRSSTETPGDIVVRTYPPESADLHPCTNCGEVSLPFPHVNSPTCSWCWFTKNRTTEQPNT